MMRHTHLRHEFVTTIPEILEPGVLYISMEYATAVHSCCCGCGVEVVTPFTPTDWKMSFDGETISLWPSIGNWNEPCRSHYIIERSRVVVARPWSNRQIKAEVERDVEAKREFYADRGQDQVVFDQPVSPEASKEEVKPRLGFWQRLLTFIREGK